MSDEIYDTGNFCKHYSDPSDCDEICECGHKCFEHSIYSGDCCGCSCLDFKDKKIINMTILELLKSDVLPPPRLSIGDYWIYWDEDTNEWVVCNQKRYAHKIQIVRFTDEYDAVNYIKSKVE